MECKLDGLKERSQGRCVAFGLSNYNKVALIEVWKSTNMIGLVAKIKFLWGHKLSPCVSFSFSHSFLRYLKPSTAVCPRKTIQSHSSVENIHAGSTPHSLGQTQRHPVSMAAFLIQRQAQPRKAFFFKLILDTFF